VASVSAIAVWFLGSPARQLAQPPATRVVLQLPGGTQLVEAGYPPLAISRDGTTIAFSTETAGSPRRLFVRPLDRFEPHALPGTEGAELPFFSPDARWLGYVVGGAIFKIAVEGGVPVKVGDLPFGQARGAAWTPEDRIIFGGGNTGLYAMDAESGGVSRLTQPDTDRGEQYHAWPQLVGDTGDVLFSAVTHDSSNVAYLSSSSGQWQLIEGLRDATQAQYIDSGHLAFVRSGALFAVTFSASQRTATSPAVPVLSDIFIGWNAGLDHADFAVSSSGTLVYVPRSEAAECFYMRADRMGIVAPLLREPIRYYQGGDVSFNIAVSPDGGRIALGRRSGRPSSDMWIYELERGTGIRLTSQDANISPIWSPDGRRVIFACFKGRSFELCSMPADGSGQLEVLLSRDFDQCPTSFSPVGDVIAFEENNPDGGSDIYLVRLEGNRTASAFAATAADEKDATCSPDGRLLAYSSNESGRYEVYVQPLSGGSKFRISSDGGHLPKWALSEKEIFFRHESRVMIAGVSFTPAFRATTPRQLFEGPLAGTYDVFPDGQHFAVLRVPSIVLRETNLVVNWPADLARLVAGN